MPTLARWLRVLGLALTGGLLLSCADATTPRSTDREGLLRFSASAPLRVRQLVVEVTGPGISPPLYLNFLVGPDSVARGSMTLPAGSARRIRVMAMDSAGIHTHEADTTLSVQGGVTRDLAIKLRPLTGGFGVTVTFGTVRLSLLGAADTLYPGQALRFEATAVDDNTGPVNPETLVWGSSNPAVVRVSGGEITAVRPGVATVSVSHNGIAASRLVFVGESEIQLLDGPEVMAFAFGSTYLRVRSVWKESGAPRAKALVTVSAPTGTGSVNVLSGEPALSETFASPSRNLVVVRTDTAGFASVLVGTLQPGSLQVSMNGAQARSVALVSLPSAIAGAHVCANGPYGLSCFGNNSRGQLGRGASVESDLRPVALSGVTVPPLSGVVSNEHLGAHSCAIDNGGTAWCWGWNAGGQLGDATFTDRDLPVRVLSDEPFVDIATGQDHTCGITSSQRLLCWGANILGQVGNGTRHNRVARPNPVAALDVRWDRVAAGRYFTCGRNAATKLWYCWGYWEAVNLDADLPELTEGVSQYETVSLGAYHGCGLLANGAAECIGEGRFGQLGNGQTPTASQSPVAVAGGLRFKEISAGADFTCAIDVSDDVWCWGRGDVGELGDSSRVVAQSTPVRVPLRATRLVTSGYTARRACAQSLVGAVLACWGQGSPNRFAIYRPGGRAGVAAALLPTQVAPLTVATDTVIPAGRIKVRAVDGRGVSLAAGTRIRVRVISGDVQLVESEIAVADSLLATLGNVTVGSQTGPFRIRFEIDAAGPGGTGVESVDVVGHVTSRTVAALQVDALSPLTQFVPFQLAPIPPVVRVSDGTVGTSGALLNLRASSPGGFFNGIPNPVTATTASDGRLVTGPGSAVYWLPNTAFGSTSTLQMSLATGASVTFQSTQGRSDVQAWRSSCLFAPDGVPYCWGSGSTFQTGLGIATSQTLPVRLNPGVTLTSIGEGLSEHRCGLTADGSAYCWGLNDAGAVGIGSFTDAAAPVPVNTAVRFSQISTYLSTSCGVSISGELWCWGYGLSSGFAGVSPGQRVWEPVKVPLPVPVARVAVQNAAVCAQQATGRVWCFGENSSGQLGIGSVSLGGSGVSTPTAVMGSENFQPGSLTAGTSAACALTSDGRAMCWGSGQAGVLGNGVTAVGAYPVPLEVLGGRRFTQISMGNLTTCALTADGQAYCWGNNNFGQLGIGPRSQITPVVSIAGLRFTRVQMMGFRHACGRATTGATYCWGWNANGQLGDGTTTTSDVPRYAQLPGAPAGIPVQMTRLTATSQTATVGSNVAAAPSVRVTDRDGNPLAGVQVSFVLRAGQGSFGSATVTTGADGVASAGSWTLTSDGQHLLEVTALDVPSVFFTATGVR